MPKFFLAACLVFASGLACAQSPDPCAGTSNTIETMECLAKVFKARDRELNEAYQALLKELSPSVTGDATDYPGIRKELAEAQRAWVRFRDSDCNAKYKFWEQGTIRGIMYASCRIEHTEQRTAQLKKWANV